LLAFNCPIDVGNSYKLELPNKLNSKNAFNFLLDVNNSFLSTHVDISRPWIEISKKIVDNYILLNGILISDNNYTNYLTTFGSCILGDKTIEGYSNLDLG